MTATTAETHAPTELIQVDPKALVAHPTNVRSKVGDVSDIAKTIAVVGILEPIVVARVEGGGYTILAGHRRAAGVISRV